MNASPDSDSLTLAEQLIERQSQEREGLRAIVDDARFARRLRQAMLLGAVAGEIRAPATHAQLLELIVETAARLLSARAAALFTVDDRTNELIFEVALGGKAEEVKHLRVPLGHGIAGLVAVTGQPMAVADASSDPQQAADIAERVGYAPESILCVPLFHNDRVTGVLELLDKEGNSTFSPADIEVLSMFAGQAAVAVEQSRLQRSLALLLGEVLASLIGPSEEELRDRVRCFARDVEADPIYHRALTLARQVRDIAEQGEPAAEACARILQAFADYLLAGHVTSLDLGSTG